MSGNAAIRVSGGRMKARTMHCYFGGRRGDRHMSDARGTIYQLDVRRD